MNTHGCNLLAGKLQELRNPAPRELRDLMLELDLSLERFLPYLSELDRLPYGRTSLMRCEAGEAALIHLPAGEQTRIHDHGGSTGCAYLLEGRLINRFYRLDAYGYPCLMGEKTVKTGMFYDAPRNQVHQLVNPGGGRAVSLHLYAPLQQDSRTYLPYEQVLDFVI